MSRKQSQGKTPLPGLLNPQWRKKLEEFGQFLKVLRELWSYGLRCRWEKMQRKEGRKDGSKEGTNGKEKRQLELGK